MSYYITFVTKNTRSGLTSCNSYAEAVSLADLLPDEAQPEIMVLCEDHGFMHASDDGNCIQCEMDALEELFESHECSDLCGYFHCDDVAVDPKGCYERLVLGLA